MTCTSPFKVKSLNGHIVDVPCGRCMACRIARAREWASRIIHEMDYWDTSIFITLTYNEEYLPKHGSIHKRDLVLFFKRLRRDLERDNRKIKYFASGEYGDKFGRPHYHAIVFGLSLREDDKNVVGQNWPYGHTIS